MLKAEFADQNAIEIETTERIAERALKWAKTFGFFIGIPVVLVISFLGFIGIKTWSDVTVAKDNINKATNDLSNAQKQLDLAGQRTHEVLAEADSFKQQIQQARDRLAAIPELQQRQRDLEAKFRNFVFRGSDNESARKIDVISDRYKKYLMEVGLAIPKDLPEFTIQSETGSMMSYYDPADNKIVVSQGVIDDPSVWLRDFTHQILWHQEGQKELSQAIYAVESIIAFYLPCSFLEDPRVGRIAAKAYGQQRPYLFNLDRKSDFADYQKLDQGERPYAGAEIVRATFWEIRGIMDHKGADQLLVSAWLAFARTTAKPDVAELLRIYRKQFDSSDLARYKADIDRIFRDHNAQL